MITIKVNNLEEKSVGVMLGEYKSVENDVDNENVKVIFKGDRRLVMMETSFNKKIKTWNL